MYVYIRSEPDLWTVGHYTPAGKWLPESDHATREEAATRVHWLNGKREPTNRDKVVGLQGMRVHTFTQTPDLVPLREHVERVPVTLTGFPPGSTAQWECPVCAEAAADFEQSQADIKANLEKENARFLRRLGLLTKPERPAEPDPE